MAVHVTGPLMVGDRTDHIARLVDQGLWAVSYLPGRTVSQEQAIAAMSLAETLPELTALARSLGLTPCEAIGQAMFGPRLAGPRPSSRRRTPAAGEM
ncbi:hypothetical protein [Nocardia nova]|uniref:hypothetical protein n=1 Tax=Nocardia nova TaxID=37330 RepID=UPI00189611E5|nr:hypothetical protein [Nocardia nova]MBF6150221.1 hypothetical protein [Nocardia nova]